MGFDSEQNYNILTDQQLKQIATVFVDNRFPHLDRPIREIVIDLLQQFYRKCSGGVTSAIGLSPEDLYEGKRVIISDELEGDDDIGNGAWVGGTIKEPIVVKGKTVGYWIVDEAGNEWDEAVEGLMDPRHYRKVN